jgi:PAS domain-containing protein
MLTSTLSKEAPFVDIQDGITLANAIVDTVRDPLVVLDHDLRVIAASRSFYNTFQLVRADVRGHSLEASERILPAGTYEVVTDEEMLVPAQSYQGSVEMLTVDPLDLATAKDRDTAATSNKAGGVPAEVQ